MGLFTPAWNKDNKKKRIKAVEKAKNNRYINKLIEIMENSNYDDTVELALDSLNYIASIEVEKTIDINRLVEIMENSYYNEDIRVLALDRVNSLAKNAPSIEIRMKAIKRATNQPILEDIAKNAEGWFVRLEAVTKIKNEDILEDIAKNDECVDIQDVAVVGLTNDLNKLRDIAINANVYSGLLAIIKVGDKDILENIFKNANNIDVSSMAYFKMADSDKFLFSLTSYDLPFFMLADRMGHLARKMLISAKF